MLLKNIILCGFMGCGKSTVGPELARRLIYDYTDMDAAIEEAAGKTVPEIFASQGEPAFRALEIATLSALCQRSGQVISTGGGTLLLPENAAAARQGGTVVFINCAFSLCYERIRESDRPIVRRSTRAELEALYSERLPLYRKACHYEIFNQSTPRDAVDAILNSIL